MPNGKQCEHRSTRTTQRSVDGKVVSEWITCNDCHATILNRDVSS